MKLNFIYGIIRGMAELPADARTQQTAALAAELRVVAGQLKRRLRQQAHFSDLTSSQLATLTRLERDGASTVTALARAESMRPQSMGANVAALEAAGLVSGAPDPNDGRQTLWSITPACRKRIKEGRAAREDWLFRAIQQEFSHAELAKLELAVALLKRLVEHEP
ncbi:MarR family transcriptional regulator [Dyella sp. GSA-30]|uniref:MarR family winged helix-turn-helix transcriptional regulator n=1 Tax=Dyella sp. GSA-30 TaxID=2994496 RepID=UPI002491A96B|nr:MarR family transcriptional regulator [Dyella sp. GSA-30]BDU22095.1 MarR family transcriptional regulator [Dyella sp. GSA-30]